MRWLYSLWLYVLALKVTRHIVPLPHAYVLDAVPLPPQSNSLAQVQEAPRQELFITHHAAQPAQRLVWVAQGWTCKVVSHVCVIKEERKEDLTS